MVAQQIRSTASILLQELVPESNNPGPHDQLQPGDSSTSGPSLAQLELQKFLQIGNMSQIETLNKQLDKLQKYFRVRSELLSVLSSIHSCQEMLQDIVDGFDQHQNEHRELYNSKASKVEEKQEEAIIWRQNAEALAKKIKIYEKASTISTQQVDRFMQLYNKILERVKIGKFFFSSKADGGPGHEENAGYKEVVAHGLAVASQAYEQLYSDLQASN